MPISSQPSSPKKSTAKSQKKSHSKQKSSYIPDFTDEATLTDVDNTLECLNRVYAELQEFNLPAFRKELESVIKNPEFYTWVIMTMEKDFIKFRSYMKVALIRGDKASLERDDLKNSNIDVDKLSARELKKLCEAYVMLETFIHRGSPDMSFATFKRIFGDDVLIGRFAFSQITSYLVIEAASFYSLNAEAEALLAKMVNKAMRGIFLTDEELTRNKFVTQATAMVTIRFAELQGEKSVDLVQEMRRKFHFKTIVNGLKRFGKFQGEPTPEEMNKIYYE